MSEEKGKELFTKASEAYHAKQYEEALKYFEESKIHYVDPSVEVLIISCKKKIVAQKGGQSKKETNSDTPTPNIEQDKECQEILKKQDFYDILGVKKDSLEDDIKKAYRKLAVKFHPDKNQSSHAAEAFKKISHAFTTLKDPEKKQFYDKYGSEEEYREKYHQQHNQYEEEEMDPFDLFEMFFSGQQGFYQRGGRVFRRRREEDQAEQHQQRQRAAQPKHIVYMQLLPLLKPYYQFYLDEDFYKKMTTSANKVDYYVGDRFLNYYKDPTIIKNMEANIERDYLNNLSTQCGHLIKYKNELEYKLSYYGRHSGYKAMLENELRKLDFSPCEKYYKFRERIR